MINNLKITGMQSVMSKLTKATSNINSALSRGLVKGGHFLQRESQKIVPVDTGNLKGSAFTRKLNWDHVLVGYTALYASFVHEDLTKAHGKAYNMKMQGRGIERMFNSGRQNKFLNYSKLRGENQQAKFLETPMKSKRSEILRIIANEGKRI